MSTKFDTKIEPEEPEATGYAISCDCEYPSFEPTGWRYGLTTPDQPQPWEWSKAFPTRKEAEDAAKACFPIPAGWDAAEPGPEQRIYSRIDGYGQGGKRKLVRHRVREQGRFIVTTACGKDLADTVPADEIHKWQGEKSDCKRCFPGEASR